MKKVVVLLLLFFSSCLVSAQNLFEVNKYANFDKYRVANQKLGAPAENKNRVVFMGNSITEAWKYQRPDFFTENGYVGRGISGQVTHQMLLRFRADVIDLQPKVVVILAGTNDIAQNSGFETLESIMANIITMSELADYHGIKVILCSVLPAIDFPWRTGIEPAQKIVQLNKMIEKYAAEKSFQFIDYYSSLVDGKGGLKVPEYTKQEDLVHPNAEGYKVMEALIKPAIDKALNK